MNLAKASGRRGLLALAVITCPLAMADDAVWYGGVNVGDSRARIDNARITSGLLGSGFTTTSIEDYNSDTGYKIFGGYRFNRNFSLEGGYFNLGKFGFTANTVPVGTLKGDIKLQGVNLDAVGTLPLTEKMSVFGRLGLHYTEAKDSFRGTGLVAVTNPNPSESAGNYKFGFGAQYDFTESLALRLEAERYRVNDAVGNQGDIDLVSLGIVYRFGRKEPKSLPYVPMAEKPAPVAVVSEAPPAEVAPPMPLPPPVPAKVTMSADSVFDFDASAVKPEGRQALDKFVNDLNGVSFDVITVTGHTDRIGSKAYNMKLSTRRAEAVQNYLVQSSGIPADKIVATGVGASEPETRPGDCVGKKVTPELITCLQPDRRVVVEVSGTK